MVIVVLSCAVLYLVVSVPSVFPFMFLWLSFSALVFVSLCFIPVLWFPNDWKERKHKLTWSLKVWFKQMKLFTINAFSNSWQWRTDAASGRVLEVMENGLGRVCKQAGWVVWFCRWRVDMHVGYRLLISIEHSQAWIVATTLILQAALQVLMWVTGIQTRKNQQIATNQGADVPL